MKVLQGTMVVPGWLLALIVQALPIVGMTAK
jgi:hypothetical protein